jgi:hypothetical protein
MVWLEKWFIPMFRALGVLTTSYHNPRILVTALYYASSLSLD